VELTTQIMELISTTPPSTISSITLGLKNISEGSKIVEILNAKKTETVSVGVI
jgi:hypothetical protein